MYGVDDNGAAVQLDDALADGQAEPRARLPVDAVDARAVCRLRILDKDELPTERVRA
jgi:hypothetical protein